MKKSIRLSSLMAVTGLSMSVMSAFAALAMGLNGILTALCLPWILPWLERLGGR